MSRFLSQAGGILTEHGYVFAAFARWGISLVAMAACCVLLVRPGGAVEPTPAARGDEARDEIKQAFSALPDGSLGGLSPDDAFAIERQIAHAMKNEDAKHTEEYFDVERTYREILSRSAPSEAFFFSGVLPRF